MKLLFLIFTLTSLNSYAQELFKKAECTVEKNNRVIIKAKNIHVTNANGGLRQNCNYSSVDKNFKLAPLVVDAQGGLLVSVYEGAKQLLLTHDRTGTFSSNYWSWSLDTIILATDGEEVRLICNMYYSDRNTPISLWQCPTDSDNPTK